MFKTLALSAVTALTLSAGGVFAAGGEGGHIENIDFSFDGPFGTYDPNQLQRGLQIYTEVCSACHGLKFVPIRTLSDEGGPTMPEDQIKAYAAENFEVFDAELDDFRPATPVESFSSICAGKRTRLVTDGKKAGRFSRAIWAGHQPVLQRYGWSGIPRRNPDWLYRRGNGTGGHNIL